MWDSFGSHVAFACREGDRLGIADPTSALMGKLGALLISRTLFSPAEKLQRRALEIDENSFGRDHPSVAIRLNNLAQLLQATNRPDEAEPMMRRALEVFHTSLGADHPNTITAAGNLELLLQELGREG